MSVDAIACPDSSAYVTEVWIEMFGRKDSMKEFEQMRQALKPKERRIGEARSDGPTGQAANTANTTSATSATSGNERESTPMSNITVTPLSPTHTLRPGTASPEEYSSIVSTGSTWQGSLKIEGSVRIDGRLSGEIEAKGTVLVSEGAEVNAKVRVALMIVAGSFQGEVQCDERLEIMPTGRVNGELTTKTLVVHEGAFVEGQIRMAQDKISPVPASRANGVAGALARDLNKETAPAAASVPEPAPSSS